MATFGDLICHLAVLTINLLLGRGAWPPSNCSMFAKAVRTILIIPPTLLLFFVLSCASREHHAFPYNRIEYPPTDWLVQVYIKKGSDQVQVTKKLKFRQTTYYGCYSGEVRIHLSNGQKQDFEVEWRSWIRPERIDLIMRPKKSGKERSFSAMPKGYSEIYLSDDKTAVRLPHRTALHWSIIETRDNEHSLIGEKPIWKLNREMDDYPILYLSYLAARNYYRE